LSFVAALQNWRAAVPKTRQSQNSKADLRIAYSVSETARMLGVHRISVWRRISSGELKTVRIGRGQHMIPAAELRRLKLIE
jgi:excisionase family DNA binding protein